MNPAAIQLQGEQMAHRAYRSATAHQQATALPAPVTAQQSQAVHDAREEHETFHPHTGQLNIIAESPEEHVAIAHQRQAVHDQPLHRQLAQSLLPSGHFATRRHAVKKWVFSDSVKEDGYSGEVATVDLNRFMQDRIDRFAGRLPRRTSSAGSDTSQGSRADSGLGSASRKE